ncbi:MAG: efflux RND transporter periplasmic adaptor subunit [Alphaproteobacteria bacterium]
MKSVAAFLPAVMAAFLGLTSPVAAQQSQTPPSVDVAVPLQVEVTDYDVLTGRFIPQELIEIRARVSGYLQKKSFEDGARVSEGDLLFEIDPRPFQASVASAQAEIASARADLELANLELARGEDLLKRNNIAKSEVDKRKAEVQRARAALNVKEAALRTAQLNLGFTRITSPINGRISDAKVDEGNLIAGGDAASPVLATVLSNDTLLFEFHASEAQVLRYIRLHGGDSRPTDTGIRNVVHIRLADENDWSRTGAISFIDNALDPNSGTLRIQATVKNDDHVLEAGLFGRVRVAMSDPYLGLLVPDAAIVSDQATKLVYVVNAENVVETRVVEPGPIHRGLRVIKKGLKETDRVITAGILRARPGNPVTPETVTLSLTPLN